MLVGCMRYQPVRPEEADWDMFVGERNASEETPLGGVSIPVVGMVASATTDNDHSASDGRRV